jgi:hypothetical protein
MWTDFNTTPWNSCLRRGQSKLALCAEVQGCAANTHCKSPWPRHPSQNSSPHYSSHQEKQMHRAMKMVLKPQIAKNVLFIR